jgi:hypothetical protein
MTKLQRKYQINLIDIIRMIDTMHNFNGRE